MSLWDRNFLLSYYIKKKRGRIVIKLSSSFWRIFKELRINSIEFHEDVYLLLGTFSVDHSLFARKCIFECWIKVRLHFEGGSEQQWCTDDLFLTSPHVIDNEIAITAVSMLEVDKNGQIHHMDALLKFDIDII